MLIKKVKYQDENSFEELGVELSKIIDENTIIVCIGTDKCTGDSLAPFVGTYLKENNSSIPVFGTIDEPIHAMNIKDRINGIIKEYPHCKIIGIDASIGEDVGSILLRDTPIKAGLGVGKKLPHVGNFSIVGCVTDSNSILGLNEIRLSLITNMAKTIYKAICYSLERRVC